MRRAPLGTLTSEDLSARRSLWADDFYATHAKCVELFTRYVTATEALFDALLAANQHLDELEAASLMTRRDGSEIAERMTEMERHAATYEMMALFTADGSPREAKFELSMMPRVVLNMSQELEACRRDTKRLRRLVRRVRQGVRRPRLNHPGRQLRLMRLHE